MPFHLAQHGRAPLVVGYLIDADDRPGQPPSVARLMCEALPHAAIITTVEAPIHPTWTDLETAGVAAGWRPNESVILVGYSAGCQPVRQHVLDGRPLRGVIVIDGTHASLPPAAWQVSVWKALADRAALCEGLFVATCTQQLYVEHLAQPESLPFMATRHVLERVLGEALPPGTEIDRGDLHVRSYPSANVDKAAHIAQAREVLPDMLRRFVAPLYPPPTPDTDTDPVGGTWHDPTLPLGARLIDWYQSEKAAGVREVPDGSNTSPRIREYLAICRRRGTEVPLGLTAGAWCAAMASFGLDQVARPGEWYPPPRAAGIEMEEDAKANGSWRPMAQFHSGDWVPEPGDLVICQRGTGWERHVCAFVERVGDRIATIGGNESNIVGVSLRPIAGGTEPILGFVELDRG